MSDDIKFLGVMVLFIIGVVFFGILLIWGIAEGLIAQNRITADIVQLTLEQMTDSEVNLLYHSDNGFWGSYHTMYFYARIDGKLYNGKCENTISKFEPVCWYYPAGSSNLQEDF